MNPTRVEVELSLGWCAKHPGLFAKSLRRFASDYPEDDWKRQLSYEARPGCLTLIAIEKEVRS